MYIRHFKKIFIFGALLILTLCFVSNGSAADPIVSNLSTNPAEPEPLSTVTVTINVTGENIISVNMSASECTDGPPELCFIPHLNIPMTLNDEGYYEADFTLEDDKDRSDHIKFTFTVNDNGTEYPLDENWKVYLDLDQDGNDQTSNDADKGTPGFEFIILLFALIVGFGIYKKRDRK